MYRDLYDFARFQMFLSYCVSARFSYVKLEHNEVSKGEHLVEIRGRVLGTPRYTDDGQHLRQPCPEQVPNFAKLMPSRVLRFS